MLKFNTSLNWAMVANMSVHWMIATTHSSPFAGEQNHKIFTLTVNIINLRKRNYKKNVHELSLSKGTQYLQENEQ